MRRDHRIEPTLGSLDRVQSVPVSAATAPVEPKRTLELIILIIQSIAGLLWFLAIAALYYPAWKYHAMSDSMMLDFSIFSGVSLMNVLVALLALKFRKQLRSAYGMSLLSVCVAALLMYGSPMGRGLLVIFVIIAVIQRLTLRKQNFFKPEL